MQRKGAETGGVQVLELLERGSSQKDGKRQSDGNNTEHVNKEQQTSSNSGVMRPFHQGEHQRDVLGRGHNTLQQNCESHEAIRDGDAQENVEHE